MNETTMSLKAIIEDIQEVLEVIGAESIENPNELRYRDKNIFLLYDQETGRTWAAVPVWDDASNNLRWESVLDIPADGEVPGKFLFDVIPDTINVSWLTYLSNLRVDSLTVEINNVLTVERIHAARSIRQFIGCPKLDLWSVINQLNILKTASIPGIPEVLLLIERIMSLTPSQWRVLIGGEECIK